MNRGQKLPTGGPWTTGPSPEVAYGAPDTLHPRTAGTREEHPSPSLRGPQQGCAPAGELSLMTPLLSAPAPVSAGINSQIKPLPPSPDSRQPNSANGKQMPTASLCVGQPGDKPHRPRDSSCPPGNGGEAGAQAWGRGQTQNGPHLDFTAPPCF